MVAMIAVAARRHVFVLAFGTNAVGIGRGLGILLVVFFQKLLPYFLGKRIDLVARLAFSRLLGDGDAVVDFHNSLGTDEAESGSFARAIHKIDAQRQIEARVVVQPQQDVGHVAPVFPETQAAGGIDAGGANGAGDEMHAAEQVNEQVAGDAGAVIAIVTPAEQAHRLEGHFGGAPQEAIPIHGLLGGVRRNGILPGAESGIAVPPRLHHIQLPDGSGLQ